MASAGGAEAVEGLDAGASGSVVSASLSVASADAGAPVPPPQWPSPAEVLVEGTQPSEYTEDLAAEGVHVRFGTPRGPVHVWRPKGYDAATAGVVVYLHGYYDSVDSAWVEHRLAEQFAGSHRNALFVVPEVPAVRSDDVLWKDLSELLREVRRRTRLKSPTGPVVMAGHSGAYRTLATWLDEPRVQELILLDGLYGYDDEIASWLRAGKRTAVLVAADTTDRTLAFLRRFPRAVRFEELPDSPEAVSAEQRAAPVLYLPTVKFDHMGLVTEGKVLPLVLALSPLKSVPVLATQR